MVIGLVGKTCSGKNEVSDFLELKGFYVIDVDKLGHSSLEENHEKLIEAFGKEIETDGKIDRKKLGPIVFSDPEKLEKLNGITHPWMEEQVAILVKEHNNCIINAALLESMGLCKYCDEIILVLASTEVRLERAKMRDNISEEQFLKRNANQANIGLSLFTNCKKVITIINNSTKEDLLRQLDSYFLELKRKGVVS